MAAPHTWSCSLSSTPLPAAAADRRTPSVSSCMVTVGSAASVTADCGRAGPNHRSAVSSYAVTTKGAFGIVTLASHSEASWAPFAPRATTLSPTLRYAATVATAHLVAVATANRLAPLPSLAVRGSTTDSTGPLATTAAHGAKGTVQNGPATCSATCHRPVPKASTVKVDASNGPSTEPPTLTALDPSRTVTTPTCRVVARDRRLDAVPPTASHRTCGMARRRLRTCTVKRLLHTPYARA